MWIMLTGFLALMGVLPPAPATAAVEEQPVAEEAPEEVSTVINGHPDISSEEEGFIDETQEQISEKVMRTAAWIDSFFDAKQVQAEENESTIRLKLETLIEEGEAVDFRLKASLRLVLPRLQDRASVTISGDPDDDPDFENTPAEAQQKKVLGSDKNDVTVAMSYTLKETMRRHISVSMGFRFRGIIPAVYLQGRYRHQVKLVQWTVRFTERIRWYNDVGWESRTSLDFDTTLSQRLFFRTTFQGDWYEDEKGYFYGVSFSVTQKLSERRAIEYGWINSFQTEPNNHLEEIMFRVRYRQNIWRNWIFYEIQPQIRFPKSEAFNITPGVLLILESIFGKTKR